MRPTLMVPIKNRAHFLEMYFEKGGLGGLFVRGLTELDLGDEVDLDIQFLDDQVSFRVRGTVRWRRTTGGRKSLPPGLGIEFIAEEHSGEKLLLDYAMGREVSMVHRTDRRFGAQLKVNYRANGQKGSDVTDDISEGGAFLLTDEGFVVGEVVDLQIRPPGAIFSIKVKARVAWRRDRGRRGVGLEFMFDSGRKKAQIARLVGQLKTQMIRELKVRLPKSSGTDPPS